jgi:hypothetical protein
MAHQFVREPLRAEEADRLANVNVGGKVQRGAGADGRPKWATPLV